MPDERLDKIVEFFDLASELSGAAREAYLTAACGNDAELRAEVERLLLGHSEAGDFLEKPLLADAEHIAAGLIGRRIGPYELLRELGSGGMGVVYLAQRADDAYRKEVAVKLVRSHLQRTSVVRRFKREREILARLDHPNIAQLLDGGVNEDGSQYVVMEYVDGLPITDYCDRNELNITERLNLFRTVCAAVEYAHQKLIVHRDLKPGNIFVTHAINKNAGGTVKLLDFGIAKLLDPDLSTRDLSQTGLHLLTPEYASPEQINGQKITTAGDVYSLGVVLYELLTGHRPCPISHPTLAELARAIAETDAERPSLAIRRIVTEQDAEGTTCVLRSPESVSATREGNPDKLRRRLAGELDNIVLKALRKEPAERYASAAQFGEDIERHLTQQPVLAQPPTLAYRTGKFVRRNKTETAFAAFAALVLTVLLGFGLKEWLARGERTLETYAARMNQAVQDREDFNLEGIRETLESYLPKSGEEDFRGFEWFYLWQWSNRHLLTLPHNLPGDDGPGGNFTSDGKFAVTMGNGERDGTLKFWDAETGALLSTLPYGPNQPQRVLCMGETGIVVQEVTKQTFRIWNPATGKEIASVPHAQSPITLCNLNTDDPQRRFFTAGEDGTIATWTMDGKLLSTFKTDAPVTFLGAAPKHQRLVIGIDRKKLEFRETNTGRMLASSDDPTPLCEYSDALLVGGGANGLVIWRDWRTGRELRRFEFGQAAGNRFFFQGNRVFNFGSSNEVLVKDLSTGQRLAELKGHQEWVFWITVTLDGTMAATAGGDRTIRLWDLQTYRQLAVIPAHEREVFHAYFSQDGRKLISGSQDQTAKIWDVASLLVPDTLEGHTDGIHTVAFSPDGRKLASAGRDRTIKLWDAPSGKLLHTLTGHGHDIFNVAFSPDGRRLASGSEDLTVRIWDADTGRQLKTLNQFTHRPRAVAFSRVGNRLAIGCDLRDVNSRIDDRLIRLLDATTYRELAVFKGHTNDVVSLDFSPDGKLLASGSWDGTVKLWEVATGRELATLRGHTERVWAVRFSPDGKRLASAGTDRSVKLWETATARELRTMKTHRNEVFGLAFSPDGKRLASASNDKTIKLWDAVTLRELTTFKDHQDQVWSVAFSPDGRMLASGSWDKTVKIFRAATEVEVRARIKK